MVQFLHRALGVFMPEFMYCIFALIPFAIIGGYGTRKSVQYQLDYQSEIAERIKKDPNYCPFYG